MLKKTRDYLLMKWKYDLSPWGTCNKKFLVIKFSWTNSFATAYRTYYDMKSINGDLYTQWMILDQNDNTNIYKYRRFW